MSRSMSEDSAYVSIGVGCVAVIFSFLTTRFQVGRILGGPASRSSRPIPVWQGRLIFGAVGALFILAGLASLIFQK